MHLVRLEATSFRNLSGAVEFSPGLNIIYGPNAQGKTSWLEAVYLLATTKSFRTAHPHEVIRHSETEAILRGTVARGNLTKDLQLLIGEKTKQTFVNGKREAVIRYLGTLDAIAFTADEMQVVRGAPEYRRRFLDRGIVSTVPSYLGTIAEYNRVLKQKNRLLRDASEADDPMKFEPVIQPWNDQLIALGSEIYAARTAYVEKLRAHLRPQLFEAEEITIRYRSSLEGRGDLSDYPKLLAERLVFHLRNEIATGYSLVGPHRDDLEVLSDGYEISRYGSSGQQRSALLVLDLAQMLLYYSVYEEYPVFLTDDIDAELDRTRIEILLDYLEGKSQTFVSTSKREVADHYRRRAAVFQVRAGVAGREAEIPAIISQQEEAVVQPEFQHSEPELVTGQSGADPAIDSSPDELIDELTDELSAEDVRHQAPF
ncbi:MAG TPA: DNA replication/repair protein RecF [Blastocatellia bacterium]|nr:DNA replication/repair protein RecF [Blastocatellia bacterium]